MEAGHSHLRARTHSVLSGPSSTCLCTCAWTSDRCYWWQVQPVLRQRRAEQATPMEYRAATTTAAIDAEVTHNKAGQTAAVPAATLRNQLDYLAARIVSASCTALRSQACSCTTITDRVQRTKLHPPLPLARMLLVKHRLAAARLGTPAQPPLVDLPRTYIRGMEVSWWWLRHPLVHQLAATVPFSSQQHSTLGRRAWAFALLPVGWVCRVRRRFRYR